MFSSWNRWRDGLVSAVLGVMALALYWRTLAPTVAFLFDDTLEFQYVVPRLGIVHQTGYPLYTLLGKLFTLLVPVNDPAFRLNLFSAFTAALAVAMAYLVLVHLVTHRWAAVIGALLFALGQTFWSQAVVAETYTTQMFLVAAILYLVLIWREEVQTGHASSARIRFYWLAFAMGLGLTHHRLILLIYPAVGLYVVLVWRAARPVSWQWGVLGRAILVFLAPLLLYLYLPWRGAVGSADGTYQNSLPGFFAWVTAQDYAVFLTQNPLRVQHDAAFYLGLFQAQFQLLGLFLAAVGGAWLLRRPREWILLALALVFEAGFAFNYRVEDVQVHFLTTFFLLALFAGAGADGLLNAVSQFQFRFSGLPLVSPLLGLLLLLIPLRLLDSNYSANDLSNKWDTYDYGIEILSRPLENNATIIGIQGEVTLVRYLQENRGLRTDVETIAGDKEDARLSAIEEALARHRTVYLTRPLKGAPERYSLASQGPLIRVQPSPILEAPPIASRLSQEFGSIRLVGYDMDMAKMEAIPGRWHTSNGRRMNVTLYWQVLGKIEVDAMVSIKVLAKDGHAVGQVDHRPVLSAYPTTYWREGEIIEDSYEVPVFLGAPPGSYSVNVTLYDAQSGASIASTDLRKIALEGDFLAPRTELWNTARVSVADFGPLSLEGYSLDTEGAVRPGDALPLTLLWRAGASPIQNGLTLRIWLEDEEGKAASSRDVPLGNGFPVALWKPGQYVRDWPLIRVPANVSSGRYIVKLAAARGKELLGGSWNPLSSATVATLGQVEVKARPRTMTAPSIGQPRQVAFDEKARLLGYDLDADLETRTIRLTLYWKALSLMDTSYTVFVHLLDAKNNVVSAADAIPAGGELPTAGWIENEYVTDVHMLPLPENLPDGGYPIEIGLYDPSTGTRLKTADGKDNVILETLQAPMP